MKKLFLPLALCLSIWGCSVKEDRGSCPCLLSVITTDAFSELDADSGTGWNLILTGYAEGGKIVEERFGAEMSRDTLEYTVRKGAVLMTACLTESSTRAFSGGVWRIPVGEQAEPLFACCGEVDASGETALYSVRPLKQYSTVTLLDGSGGDEPFEGRAMLVRGNSCGVDLTTLQPVAGLFECRARAVEHLSGRGFQVRIPRQADASLELVIQPREGDDRATAAHFPIGETLFAQEHTPADEEVPDYIIWLSATGAAVRTSSIITIRPWK